LQVAVIKHAIARKAADATAQKQQRLESGKYQVIRETDTDISQGLVYFSTQ
jgi:hypothetical protein